MYKIKHKYKVNRGVHRKQAFPPVCDMKHYFIVLMKKNRTTEKSQSRYLQMKVLAYTSLIPDLERSV